MTDTPFERIVPKANRDMPVLDGLCTLMEFWKWALSDLVANDARALSPSSS